MKKTIFALVILTLFITGCAPNVQRYGSVIGVKEDMLDKYKDMHASPWPEVNAMLEEVNIQNYSIYLTQFPDGKYYLFSYFEYVGDDFGADMKKAAADEKIKEWWSNTDPMQLPLSNRNKGEWWKSMQEIYHLD